MAKTIVIQKGDEMLQDVEVKKPDTKVNYKADIKYPVDDLCRRGTGGAVSKVFSIELDEENVEQTFTTPHEARQPADPDATDEEP